MPQDALSCDNKITMYSKQSEFYLFIQGDGANTPFNCSLTFAFKFSDIPIMALTRDSQSII
jgi:hypothetical protein